MSRKLLAVDTETYEENIKKWGAGYHLGKGHLIGISFADETGWSTYLPLAHPETTQEERRKNIAIAKELFAEPCLHLGHNSLYDNVYLTNELGFNIPKLWHDTQYTMSLLDEYRGRFGGPGYSLDAVAQDLIGQKKAKTEIDEYCEKMGWTGDSRQHLWEMPAKLVDKYARQDVLLLPKLYKAQMEHIKREELDEIYSVECGLLPLLTTMNNRGLQVDEKRRLNLVDKLEVSAKRLKKELTEEFGDCNYNSTKQLARMFDSMGIEYPIKEKTENPSITNKFLDKLALQGNKFAHKLVQWRKTTKVLSTFADGAFKEFQDANGVIHSTLIPMATDEGGTVSGRFADKNPNLQQVPSKDGDESLGDLPLGTWCRDIFVCNEDRWMASCDYSQLEFRMIVNFACAPDKKYLKLKFNKLLNIGMTEEKAEKIVLAEYEIAQKTLEEVVAKYNENPDTDFHDLVAEISGLPRSDAKAVNFGIAFYEGATKLANDHGWDMEKTDKILQTYHEKLPFINPSRSKVVSVAEDRGYIWTIGRRRARLAPYMVSGPYRERKTYRMYNRLPQGSGADVCKKAMVEAYQAGVFDVYDIRLQIHDELLGDIPRTKEGLEAFHELQYTMESVYAERRKVPLVAEPAIGTTWGNTEERRKDKITKKKESIESFFARYEQQV
jgi:DNA polymerase I-like protein with 3'-5' exonuclease and polymerase domains